MTKDLLNTQINAQKKILVTSALPYANGPIHLGHLVEYIQTDIWVRFLRSLGHSVYYVCADDAHGTAISIAAQRHNQSPEEMIAAIKQEHEQDLRAYGVDFDCYHTTHSEENEKRTQELFTKLQEYIYTKPVSQLYDKKHQLFLADRFVKGTCPQCHVAEQYGDNCEVCGNSYSATELINPVSTYSGETPVIKESKHYFFHLESFRNFLQAFLQTAVSESLRKKLLEWFSAPLRAWDISRDAPYFGFKIPKEDSKYFYVWLDAPVGYMASTDKLCQERGLSFDDFWGKEALCDIYHFIGKDIIYFHALFWAAILKGSSYKLPSGIFAHGFLTINGQKMSKSKGTFITAKDFTRYVDPQLLRYYFARKINGSIDDLDLNLTEFIKTINSDLVGKIINILSRSAGLLKKSNDLYLAGNEEAVLAKALAVGTDINQAYLDRNFSLATKHILNIAEDANQYINDQAPWLRIKQDENKEEVARICSTGINLFYFVMHYLQPILPELSARALEALNVSTKPTKPTKLQPLAHGHRIKPFASLLQRLEINAFDALLKNAL